MMFFLALHNFMFGQPLQTSNDTISKPLFSKEKLGLLKNVDFIFNMRFANDNLFENGKFQESEFSNNQFRLEIRGKVHERVYFRFRDSYTKNTVPASRDHISSSTDLAFIDVLLTPTTDLYLGKLSTDWGGYEFDLNSLYILEYNDILNNAESFLTGIGVTQKVSNNHLFGLQILNSRTANFSDVYAGAIPPHVEKSKFPMAVVTNWRGSFWDGKFETIYSYSYFNEAEKHGMNYYSLGNKYQNDKLTVMYDFKYSHEAIDRKGIVTRMIPGEDVFTQENVSYLENWLKVGYLVMPKLNLSLVLMNSNAYAKDIVSENSGTSHLRSSYGFIPMVEYMPFKKFNLRFYASYVGRYYNYSGYAKEVLQQSDYNTGRLSFGFIAPLKVF